MYDISDWNQYNDSNYTNRIVARAKGMVKVSDVLHGKIRGDSDIDQIASAMEEINSDDKVIRTSSQLLNNLITGFSRGYVDTVGAKSGHCKSSWSDYNILQNILQNKVRKVTVITPEESATTRITRLFAMICGISTTAMREKTVEVLPEHVAHVDKVIGGRLHIVEKYDKMKDILDVMHAVDDETDMIYIDHINGIDYPGGSDHMRNMIGNIPGLVQREKRIAKEKNINIVNLSQVKDKDIMTSESRLMKFPRYYDLYGSSVLYQAAREMLMLWYPIKDVEDSGTMNALGGNFDPSDLIIRVEKSSFSALGSVKLTYNPAFNTFADKGNRRGGSAGVSAPNETPVNPVDLSQGALF
jgi:replicative DNA helicase